MAADAPHIREFQIYDGSDQGRDGAPAATATGATTLKWLQD
jgi:hypothetical protein